MKLFNLSDLPPHLHQYFEPVQELGLEPHPNDYVEAMVAVFREVRRVLRPDGVLWLNLGDSYAAGGQGAQGGTGQRAGRSHTALNKLRRDNMPGFKPKDLFGIPWRVAFALQADGWWLRADVVWAKPSPMPEAVTDRPTRAHEFVFLLTKCDRYFYNASAIRDPGNPKQTAHNRRYARPYAAFDSTAVEKKPRAQNSKGIHSRPGPGGHNRRDVWTITAEPYPDAHFATMPSKLAEPCILAGSRPGDLVLDPFAGAGTTLLVAKNHGRRALGIELSQEYAGMIERRLVQDVMAVEVSA